VGASEGTGRARWRISGGGWGGGGKGALFSTTAHARQETKKHTAAKAGNVQPHDCATSSRGQHTKARACEPWHCAVCLSACVKTVASPVKENIKLVRHSGSIKKKEPGGGVLASTCKLLSSHSLRAGGDA
jgi:hypothetical protein